MQTAHPKHLLLVRVRQTLRVQTMNSRMMHCAVTPKSHTGIDAAATDALAP